MTSTIYRLAVYLSSVWLSVVWLGAVALAAATAEPELEAPTRPVLLDYAVVLIRSGEVVGTIPLPESTMSSKLEPLATGWVAGGTRETETGTDLSLLQYDGADIRELEVPVSVEMPRLRGYATPLVNDGALAGLLWLEGERHNRLAVRAAAWYGDRWGTTELVSTPGPGSQVALSGIVLDDGSWLAVWTWVDEQGDAETVWSRRETGTWSPPVRIYEDNDFHDVQPVLAQVEGGAVVAWSAFDGSDYRMRRGRFDGRRWAVSPHFGGLGASSPAFAALPAEGGNQRPTLIYSTVLPATWSLVDFGPDGRATGFGQVGRDLRDAGPVLLTAGEAGAELIWPSFTPEVEERRAVVPLLPASPAPQAEVP